MYCGFTGYNEAGQLGYCGQGNLTSGNETGDALPTLDFGSEFVPEFMGLGEVHSCFVSTEWSMVCFGMNEEGQVQVLYFIVCLERFEFWCSLCWSQLGYGDSENRGGCNELSLSSSANDFRVCISQYI